MLYLFIIVFIFLIIIMHIWIHSENCVQMSIEIKGPSIVYHSVLNINTSTGHKKGKEKIVK